MNDKPRGRIRSALMEALTMPAATDSDTLGRDSDPWSTPAGQTPGDDLERVTSGNIAARVPDTRGRPFETFTDQHPRAAVPFALEVAGVNYGQPPAGFVAQPPTPGATAWVNGQTIAANTPVQIVPANQEPRKVLLVVRGTGAAYLHPLQPNASEYTRGLDVTATTTLEISTAGAIWIVSPVGTVTVSVWVDYDQSAQLIAKAVSTARPCSCGSH
jgi:hypothetical protein